MAKELPYFKFYIGDWITGDVTLEDYETQGVFINLCAFYWAKDCEVSEELLYKKFRGYDDSIKTLIKSKIIKVINGNLSISFLNEQWDSKQAQKVINQNNGKKGGRAKRNETDSQTENKPNGLEINQNETERVIYNNPTITNIEKSNKEDKEEKIKEDKELSFFENDFEVLKEDKPIDQILFENAETAKSKIIDDSGEVDLNQDLIKWFGFENSAFYRQKVNISHFVKLLIFENNFDHFKQQFAAYKDFKTQTGNAHNVDGFLGVITDGFKTGKWNDTNWIKKLEDHEASKTKPKQTIKDVIEISKNVVNPFREPNNEQNEQ